MQEVFEKFFEFFCVVVVRISQKKTHTNSKEKVWVERGQPEMVYTLST